MKRFWLSLMIAMMVVAVAFVAAACDKSASGTEEPSTTSYTIQYTDDDGTHVISVESGMPYSIESLPVKEGYEFKGLFDAEVGGTKYVSEKGASLSVFTDKKNMVLFPQFAPKEYVVALDYQGAAVTGSRQFTVDYDAALPDLPVNLTLENKVFTGWYTEPDRGGTQVADEYGNLPLVSRLNSENFDLSGKSITLYAGFVIEQYTITFYADGKSEEMKVDHGALISTVVPDFRKDGKAVLSWSKKQNDPEGSAVFTGKVMGEMVLYAFEWAPILEFDAAGGDAVASIVEKAGESLSLPTPTRKDYVFVGWFTSGGEKFTATEMPEMSAKLTARWNAQLVFDVNGGSEVSNMSEAYGTRIELPTPEREGYVFAGWYTNDKQKYESTTMSADSVRLKAGWYKSEERSITLIDSSKNVGEWETPPVSMTGKDYHQVDLSDLYESGVRSITITVHYNVQYNWYSSHSDSVFYAAMEWYDSAVINPNNLLWKYQETFQKFDPEKRSITLTNTLDLNTKNLYIFRSKGPEYAYISSSYGIKRSYPAYVKWSDFWIEIEYPDTSTLY